MNAKGKGKEEGGRDSMKEESERRQVSANVG